MIGRIVRRFMVRLLALAMRGGMGRVEIRETIDKTFKYKSDQWRHDLIEDAWDRYVTRYANRS